MKKTLLNLLLVLMGLSASGQVGNDYYNRMEHIFGAIDKNNLPQGF